MGIETERHLSPENGHRLQRPFASFVRDHQTPFTIDSDHVRAYVGLRYMQLDLEGGNPFFFHKGGQTELTGLEPYLIGATSDPMEVAEEIGTLGAKVIKSLEALHGPYAMPRINRLVRTGRLSTDVEEREADLRILLHADSAIGNIVRRFQTSITPEGEHFRAETHRLIGNPSRRFNYSVASRSETLILPHDLGIRKQLDVQKRPLDEVLTRLPLHLRRGYGIVAHLVRPVFAGPVERAELKQLRLRSAFI